MRKIVIGTIIGMVLAGSAMANEGLNVVKEFELTHAKQLHENAAALKALAIDYDHDLSETGYNYDKSWKNDHQDLAKDLENMKKRWLACHNNYELIEGMVAGMPQTVKYDLILDAGIPASEGNEDVAPYDLKCEGGKTYKRPGNFFHVLLEPTLWGTNPKFVKKHVDLNDDGVVTKTEVLPDAKWLKCAATGFEKYTGMLVKDVKKINPTLTDVFTAELTMVPTMGDYFGEWKDSKILMQTQDFVAATRLIDIKEIAGGLSKAYKTAISPKLVKIDPKLDNQIKMGFFDLLSLVDDTYMQERAGKKYTAAEADAYASEAQDKADHLASLIAKAAKKLNIRPNM